MALQLRRPILVGGLGLTFGALLLDQLGPSVLDFGGTAVWGAIALGSGVWWWKQQTNQNRDLLQLPLTPVDRSMVDKALTDVEARINQLVAELNPDAIESNQTDLVTTLRQRLAALHADLDRQSLRIAVIGGKAVGKTTLAQLLKVQDLAPNLSTIDHPSQSSGMTTEPQAMEVASSEVETADLILFVTTGDLADSELQTMQQLMAQRHRILLIFNKQDQYLPDDRPVILQSLRERVKELLPADDVIAISAQPAAIKVRRYQTDGTMQEAVEQPTADVASLQERLRVLLTQQGPQLVPATVLRQAQALNRAVQTELNQLRRVRALPAIEQYQWIAAAAAFANPVPTLDLLATATINAQLVVDLSALYQQKFSLEQAKTVAATLASQMVKLGLVEVASQTIAPMLKSHALTYVAGGTLQGISAAYLTRLAGLSLVEYFEERSQTLDVSESAVQVDRLVQKLKAVFQDNQRSAFLQSLVKQGIQRLVPSTSTAVLPGAAKS
jgi:uncharacterized protein (DUF697 family)